MKDLRSSGDTLTFVRYKIRHDSKPRVIPFAPTQQSDESPEVPVNRQRLSLSFRLAEKNSIVGENTFKQSTRPFKLAAADPPDCAVSTALYERKIKSL